MSGLRPAARCGLGGLARSQSLLVCWTSPFSGLDLRSAREVCALVREVSQQDERFKIVIVSHDIDAVLAISDTIWLLGRGRPTSGEDGARILHTFDLMERGLAWQTDVRSAAGYAETKRELEARFWSSDVQRAATTLVQGCHALEAFLESSTPMTLNFPVCPEICRFLLVC